MMKPHPSRIILLPSDKNNLAQSHKVVGFGGKAVLNLHPLRVFV